MNAVVYIYIATPAPVDVPGLLEALVLAGGPPTHAGLTDPPRKWSGSGAALAALVLSAPEANKYLFLRFSRSRIDLTLRLNHDPQWSHSSIAADSPDGPALLRFARALLPHTRPYLAFHGLLGAGKDQAWHMLFRSPEVPSDLQGIAAHDQRT